MIGQWAIVIGVNLSIIVFGLLRARDTKTATDWFLAAKGLPWWMVGLSMFATAVDSGDYVAVAGHAYDSGMSYLSAWWLGLTVGWMLVAYFVFVPVYRTGMFTNAEYLEYRFGPLARLICVFIQIQYRTNVLANVAFSLFLTFRVATGFDDLGTWCLVGAIALGAAVYTAMGGVRSVAITDSLQSIVMLVASLTLWWIVWQAAGSWGEVAARLEGRQAGLAHSMLHIGGYQEPDGSPVPPLVVVFGWIIVLSAYCVVNHSQSMRMLSARSEWDMKMAAIVAALVTAVVMWFNVTLGVLGRSLMPDLEHSDQIFPKLLTEYLPQGLMGIVLAGLLAGGISTFDSIGSALAAVFTRDFYARFLYRSGTDRHYLTVSRWSTVFLIGISFVYIPFMGGGMVKLYLKLVGVAVIPLMTVYLMGVLTRVHRHSGAIGLLIGVGLGATRFLPGMPWWWTNTWYGYIWSILGTAIAMVVASLILGWESRTWMAGLTAASGQQLGAREVEDKSGWLYESRQKVPIPKPISPDLPWYRCTWPYAILTLLAIALINLVIFW